MELASADYITFLDSDDKLGPEFIESTYNEVVENDVDIVKTAFVVGFDKKMSYSQNLGRVVVPSDNITPLMTYNYLEAWSTMYNKKFLLDNDLKFSYKYKIHENFLFSIQALNIIQYPFNIIKANLSTVIFCDGAFHFHRGY